VIGQSGTGKSSVIAWLCSQLPPSHFALRIPVTGVEDPGSVGEVARLALSITLDEIVLDNRDQAQLEQARADSKTATRTPAGVSAKLGGGPIPAEVNVNVASLREEFTQNRLDGDHLLALNGRLVPILAEAGITPVFVFEDTEAIVGGADDRERAEAFFAGPLSAFIDQIDAPTLVAVQTHLTEGSRAFDRLAPVLERLTIPCSSSTPVTSWTRSSHAGSNWPSWTTPSPPSSRTQRWTSSPVSTASPTETCAVS